MMTIAPRQVWRGADFGTIAFQNQECALDFKVEDQFVAHIPALQRFARTLTRAPERADDLVQDCLERALSKRALFRQPNNPRAWLFKIMHNIYRNQVSREKPSIELSALEEISIPATQDTSVELMDVKRAMSMLSKEHQEILMLISVEGLSYKEAAEILDVQKGTIMSRLARARDNLRTLLSGENLKQKEAQ